MDSLIGNIFDDLSKKIGDIDDKMRDLNTTMGNASETGNKFAHSFEDINLDKLDKLNNIPTEIKIPNISLQDITPNKPEQNPVQQYALNTNIPNIPQVNRNKEEYANANIQDNTINRNIQDDINRRTEQPILPIVRDDQPRSARNINENILPGMGNTRGDSFLDNKTLNINNAILNISNMRDNIRGIPQLSPMQDTRMGTEKTNIFDNTQTIFLNAMNTAFGSIKNLFVQREAKEFTEEKKEGFKIPTSYADFEKLVSDIVNKTKDSMGQFGTALSGIGTSLSQKLEGLFSGLNVEGAKTKVVDTMNIMTSLAGAFGDTRYTQKGGPTQDMNKAHVEGAEFEIKNFENIVKNAGSVLLDIGTGFGGYFSESLRDIIKTIKDDMGGKISPEVTNMIETITGFIEDTFGIPARSMMENMMKENNIQYTPTTPDIKQEKDIEGYININKEEQQIASTVRTPETYYDNKMGEQLSSGIVLNPTFNTIVNIESSNIHADLTKTLAEAYSGVADSIISAINVSNVPQNTRTYV